MSAVRDWYAGRTAREQRLLLLMAAIAVPLFAWLLVIQPLERAYQAALQEQLEAVDRHGRVKALAEAAQARPAAASADRTAADLQLIVTESATRAGVALHSASPGGPESIDVAIEGEHAPEIVQWLADLHARGVAVDELRITPQAPGTVDTSVRLVMRR